MERDDLEEIAVAKKAARIEYGAGYAVQKALILNAWRKSRRKSEQLTLKSEKLRSKMRNMQLQVTVLHQLLDGEVNRMSNACALIRILTEHSETNTKLRRQSEREKEASLEEYNHMDQEINNLRERCLNYQNTLAYLRDDCSALENRLRKEREKIVRIREQNKLLVTKVHEYEGTLQCKSERITELEQMIQEIEIQAQHLSGADVKSISSTQVLPATSRETLSSTESEGDERVQLLLKVASLEREVKELVAQNKSLGGNMYGNDQQIADLSSRLDEPISPEEEEQESWGQRALDIVTRVIRIPLQVLVFLHTTGLTTLFTHNTSS